MAVPDDEPVAFMMSQLHIHISV